MINIKYDKYKIALFSVLVFAITSCSNNSNPNSPQSSFNVLTQNTGSSNNNGQVILGKKLKDPYTVEAMQEALDSLIQNRTQSGLFKTPTTPKLKANYLYIRFLPKGKQETSYIQERDKELVLHVHPIGYEILQEGFFYIDSTLPDSVVAFYTAVPIDYHFTDTIAYEILDSLFLIKPILNEIETNSPVLFKTTAHSSVLKSFHSLDMDIELLEVVSLKLTGHLQDLIGNAPSSSSSFLSKIPFNQTISSMSLDDVISSWWNPTTWVPPATKRRGRLTYQDEQLGVQPMVGLRVTAGYWYYWRGTTTYADGSFSIPEKWRYSTKFQAHFETDDFVVQDDGWEWDRWQWSYIDHHIIQGPNQKANWNRNFVGTDARFAVVFTAAWQYYYGNIDGLPRPRRDHWYTPRLDIELYFKKDWGDIAAEWLLNPLLLIRPPLHLLIEVGSLIEDLIASGRSASWPALTGLNWTESVRIYIYKDNVYLSHQKLYGLSIHELSHSAFWEYSKHHNNLYQFLTTYFSEPRVVELIESYARGIEWWITKKRYAGFTPTYPTTHDNHAYTGIVEDLVDTDTLFANRERIDSLPDKIQGFTIQEINNAFLHAYSWDDLKNSITSIARSELDPLAIDLKKYIKDYKRWGFDATNRYRYSKLKTKINSYLNGRNLLEGYMDTTLLLDSLILYKDWLLSQQGNSIPQQNNADTLRQRSQVFDTYFSNLDEVFNYWKNL